MTPAPDSILSQVLRHRHAALTRKPLAAAAARHEQLLARSASYGEVLEMPVPPGGVDGDWVDIAGLSFFVPADSRKPGSLSDLLINGRWLPFKDILRSRELAVGGGMIDIGANIGTTSIPRAALGDFEFIYGAEPAPANYAALVTNVKANKLCGIVLPDRVAIGSTNEAMPMELARKLGGHRVLSSGTSKSDPRRLLVKSMTLDRWVEHMGIDLDGISFVKCDTQGWEGHVLRGASNTLQTKHIVWQLECWPEGWSDSGVELEEVLDRLAAHFSHFVDLRGQLPGPRVQPTTKLRESVTEFVRHSQRKRFTDLVVYNAS